MTNNATRLDEVLAGAYRDQYVIYTRKSTDDGDNQKNSILFQKSECQGFAQQQNLPLAQISVPELMRSGIISERHSAFKQGGTFEITEDGQMNLQIERPKFQKLLYFLRQGHFKGVIIYCPDRAHRNDTDEVALKKLTSEGVDIRYVTTAYDESSAGKLHRDIDGMFAKHHSRVTSEKVRGTIRKLRGQGKCTYQAPIGYLNEGNPNWKPLDPDRAPIIKESFHLYASGEWSYHTLAKWCNDQGLKTIPARRRRTRSEMLADDEIDIKPVSRPVTYNSVARWLKNPFYLGLIVNDEGNWQSSTSHEALVDQETFDRVQDIRTRKKISVHYTQKLDYPFRGMLRCGDCGRAFCPYKKKGIIYYGLRCRAGCSNSTKNINLPLVEDQLLSELSGMVFSPDEQKRLNAATDQVLQRLSDVEKRTQTAKQRKQMALQEKLTYLEAEKLNLLITGTFTPEAFAGELEKLQLELAETDSETSLDPIKIRETLDDIKSVSELLETLCFYWEHMKSDEKDAFARIFFSELAVQEKTFNFRPKSPFVSFISPSLTVCDQIDWLPELEENRGPLTTCREELSKLLECRRKSECSGKSEVKPDDGSDMQLSA